MSLSTIVGVGFDVGVRNLGMAIVKRHLNQSGIGRFECLKLDLIDLNSRVTNEAVETLCTKLDIMWPELQQCHWVNIEQQPEHQHVSKFTPMSRQRDNTQMKSISHAIQAFFLSRGMPVEFVSPKSKLNVYDGPPIDLKSKSTKEYYLRKRMAIAHAKAMLEGQDMWLQYIKNLEKKDDVCDAYLQCCYHLDRKAGL